MAGSASKKQQRRAKKIQRVQAGELAGEDSNKENTQPQSPARSTPASDQFETVEAILHDTMRLRDDDDLEAVGRQSLRLEVDKVHLDISGVRPAVGNWAGLKILEEREENTARITRLEATINTLSKKMEEQQQKMEEQQQKVEEQQQKIEEQQQHLYQHKQRLAEADGKITYTMIAADRFLKIRNRLFEKYLNASNPSAHTRNAARLTAIKEGNEVAHEGDAEYDALLYTKGTRRDDTTFSDIYGMSYAEVLKVVKIRDDKVMSVIDAHGTSNLQLAMGEVIQTKGLKDTFAHFRTQLRAAMADSKTESVGFPTALRETADKFWREYNNGKRLWRESR